MKSKWNIDQSREKARLAPKEADWNLDGKDRDKVLGQGRRELKKRSFLGD
jgi:hypothetical protein